MVSGPAWGQSEAPAPTPDGLTDEELLELALQGAGEVVEVWGERPDKPFDRDTALRLTGEELARRGATNLAEALDLLPDVRVREAGRGGRQIDIRGARKGSVKILLDGVSIADPYYGNLDISSIPITDIAQIRVSSSPASPIDGTGGPGGVIEIHTRDAIGPRMFVGRLLGTTLPSAEASATGRIHVTDHLALRMSGAGTLGLRAFDVAVPGGERASVDEDRRQTVGALRVEYRRHKRRAALDVTAKHVEFLVPPASEGMTSFLVVDGETQARAGASFEDEVASTRIAARSYFHTLSRTSSFYEDAALSAALRDEKLRATRTGASVLVNRPFGPDLHLVGSVSADSESVRVCDFAIDAAQCDADPDLETRGRATVVSAAAGALAEHGALRVDGAAGVSVPVGLGASPWPEAKIAASYRLPTGPVVKVTGGHKGRAPTLRERFRLDGGNRTLGPERASFVEAAVTARPLRALKLGSTAFARQTNGLVRFDPMADDCPPSPLATPGCLINTGELAIRGFDARADLFPDSAVGGGGSVVFTDAHSPDLGIDPLDFLPRYRAEAWLTGRVRERAGATARLRYLSSQIDRAQTLPSRTTVDVSAYAWIGDAIMANLRVDNALGKSYEVRGGVLAPGRVVMLTLQGHWERPATPGE